MESARRIMRLELEVMLLMVVENSWPVEMMNPVVHLPVQPADATGASIEEKWRLR